MTAAIFDRRWDGNNDNALLGICLPGTQTLRIITLTKRDGQNIVATPRESTPALAVAHVRATRNGVYDLLVLRPNRRLSLLTLGTLDMPVELTDSPKPFSHIDLPGSPLPPGSLKLQSLKDGTNSQVTFVFENGTDIRVSMNLMPHDSLTRQCLQIFAMLLPVDFFFSFHRNFLLRWSRLGCPESNGAAYGVFCDTLFDVFGVKPSGSAFESDPWQALARNKSTTRFREDPALKRLSLPPTFSTPPVSAPIKPHGFLAVALHGLHQVAIDNIISVDHHDDLLQLVPLICQLALIVRPEWADFWKRYYPDAIDEWPASTGELACV